MIQLDFGAQFLGASRWPEIAVRTNGASGFTPLTSRQTLLPAPYAVFAGNAGGLAVPTNQSVNLTVNGSPVLRINSVFDPTYGTYTVNTLGGSAGNVISNGIDGGLIAGGGNSSFPNRVGANYASVFGGLGNTASGLYAVAGGTGNAASGIAAVVFGGVNVASGYESTVPGGSQNIGAGDFSFAAGFLAQAMHTGTFVWSDEEPGFFSSSAPSQFLIRASGGVGIGTTNPAAPLHVGYANANGECLILGFDPHAGGYTSLDFGLSASTGGYAWPQAIKSSGASYGNLILNPNFGNVGIGTNNPGALLQVGSATCDGATWQNASDKTLKEHFQPVNAQAMLDKVLALPITEWNYQKAVDVRHIGPMAQDFHAVFGFNGTDDKHIATVDEGGVALAAIQGLNQKMEEKDSRIKEQAAEIAELQQSVAELKATMQSLAARK